MPNIIFDDDLMYVRPNVSEEDLEKEKRKFAQDRANMEQELLNEDENLRAIAQKRIERYDSHIQQLDEHKEHVKKNLKKK